MKPSRALKSSLLILSIAALSAAPVLAQSQPRRGQAQPKATAEPKAQPETTDAPRTPRPPAAADGMVQNTVAYPTGETATSVVLIERLTPAERRANQEFEYQIKLTNLTKRDLGTITLAERLPAGFELKGTGPKADTLENGVLTWKALALPVGQTTLIRVQGSATKTTDLDFCATLTFNTTVCSPMKIVEPKLQLTKTLPAEVILCDPIPMRLTVSNTGTATLKGVRILDTLPEGWTTADGKASLALDAGDLAPQQSRTFNVELKSSKTGEFTNTAKAEEPGGVSASASAKTVVRVPNLVVKKTGPQMRYVGRPAEYEITVQNTGDAPAKDTVLVDTVTGGAFVRASDNGRNDGSKVTWNLGTLAPGASAKVTVTFSSDQIGEIRNQAVATAYCAQGEASAVTRVRGVPAILLELADVNDPIVVGAEEVYNITITNQGTAADKNVQIVVTIPDEEEYISSDGPTKATVEGKKVTFAAIPSLAAKEKARYKVITRGTKQADVRFRVDLTSDMLTSPVVHTESTHIYE